MITDLDRTDEIIGPRPGWPLPFATALCVLAFIGATVATTGPRLSDTAGTGVAASAAPVIGVPTSPVRVTRPATVALPEIAAPTSATLGLPAGAYKTVTRVVNWVTTGLSPADEEALTQLRYRLPDDRVAVLVRLPRSDPLRGIEPASYTAGSLVVRGIEARVLTGRTAVEPTILLWGEGIRAYQLYSSVHSIAELAQIAEQLR